MIPQRTHSPTLLRLVVPPDFVEDLGDERIRPRTLLEHYQLTACWLLATWGSTLIASIVP